MSKSKGFTLIELLVVIAIIGILSSVVLASLNTARAKGADAAIKGNLASIRAQAELQYDNEGGCYSNDGTGTACSATAPVVFTPGACPASGSTASIFGQSTIAAQIAAAITANSGYAACSATVGGGAYAVVAQYKSDPLKGWCIDSTGKSKEVTISANSQAGVALEVAAGACVE
jgi:prepilin-type N-terminal cleavage/methylation domain-containing protein